MEETILADDFSRLGEAIDAVIDMTTENSQHSTSVVADLLDLLADRYELTMGQEDVERGISLGTATLHQLDDTEPNRRYILAALARLFGLRYSSHGVVDDIDSAIANITMALSSPPQDSKSDYSLQHDLTIYLWEKYITAQGAVLLDQYIDSCEAVLNQVNLEDPDLPHDICMRARGFERRFDLTGDLDALQKAIRDFEVALKVTAKDDPDRLERLKSLAICLEHRFEKLGTATELDNIIQVCEEAEKIPSPDNFQRDWVLSTLGGRLRERYLRDGQAADLDCAIAILDEAVSISLDTPGSMANLGTLLLMRFHRSSELADVDRCVELTEQARAIVSLGDPTYARLSHSMATAYAERFHCRGDLTDLEKAIMEDRKAVETVAPDEPRRFHMRMTLAEHLCNLFEHSRNRAGNPFAIEILEEAIRLGSGVLKEGPRDSEDWPLWLATNGNLSVQSYRAGGGISDIDKAVRLTNEAVSMALPEHQATPYILTSNASCLRSRFDITGSLEDINHAVEIADRAVEVTQEGASGMPDRLVGLSMCLTNRSVAAGTLADMYHAIEAVDRAVQLTPTGSIHRAARLRILSQSYSLRYRRTRLAIDLDKAIQATTTAIDEIPDYRPEKALLVSARATHIYHRALTGGSNSRDDFNEAPRLYEQALELLPKGDVARPTTLTGLGSALLGRFIENGSVADSNRSIEMLRESLGDMAMDDISRIGTLNKLGMSYVARFAGQQDGSRNDLEEALRCFTECFRRQGGYHTERIQGAMGASDVLGSLSRPQEALEILKDAIDLLPLVTQQSLPQLDQQILLKAVSGLGSKAAAAALSSGASGAEALMLLERSRGIIAGLLMSARPDDLSMLDAEAASDFLRARERLSALCGSREPGLDHPSVDWNLARSSFILRSKAQTEAEEELLAIIRRIQRNPKTQGFLKPPSESEVLKVLGEDTVVFVNADHTRCDALILNRSYGSRVVQLTKLDTQQVLTRLDRIAASRPYLELMLLEWLWDTIAEPVLDALGFCEPPSEGNHPRIFWIMAGDLHPFPIHAAGRHTDGSRNTVMDRAMSSYASSLRSFVHSRSREFDPSEAGHRKQALLVSMGQSKSRPELPELPLAVEEVDKLETLSPRLGLEPVRLECPTRTTVLSHLESCAFFHFAGHGVSDPLDPSRNGLLLEDGLLTVADLQGGLQDGDGPLDHTRPAFLSYLSACLTGANDAVGLEDEGIHLIGAFQLGGFRHVIGALWQVFDATCPLVAESVYRSLAAAPLTDRAVCAALHGAVRRERDAWLCRLPQQKEAREPPSDTAGGCESPRRRELGWVLDNLRHRDGRLNLRKKDGLKLVKAEWVSYVHYGA